MIYTLSLGPLLKKAYPGESITGKRDDIIKQLVIDPTLSGIDVLVLREKDVQGLRGKALAKALQNKHPKVEVILFYKNAKDKTIVTPTESIKIIQSKRIEVIAVKQEVSIALEKNQNVQLNKKVKEIEEIEEPTTSETVEDIPIAEKIVTPEVEPELEVKVNLDKIELPRLGDSLDLELTNEKSIEERVKNLADQADFNFLIEASKKDIIVRDLLHENSEFRVAMQMIDTMDKRVMNVFRDTDLSSDMKMDKIRTICHERSGYSGLKNSLLAEKYFNVMGAIVDVAEISTKKKIDDIRKALGTLTAKNQLFVNNSELQGVIDDRLKIQLELQETAQSLVNTYRAIDSSVGGFIDEMINAEPTANAYVNEVVKPIKRIFTPANTTKLVDELVRSLQAHRISISAIDEKISELIGLVFKLCESDQSIIEYQSRLIELLTSQRVEDVIVIDNIIKKATHIITGSDYSGKTATAVCRAYTASRKGNTILVDLTDENKLINYGITAIPFKEFRDTKIEEDFLALNYKWDGDEEELQEFIQTLKMRLHHYKNIFLLTDITDVTLNKILTKSALSMNFITNGTPVSMRHVREINREFREAPVGHHLTLVNPPINEIDMMRELDIDPLIHKLHVIPELKYIRACSIKKTNPAKLEEVRLVFQEEFR